MELLPADYVLGALTAILAVMGLFRGFSGTLGALAGSAAAAAAGSVGWRLSAAFLEATWARALAALVVALLAFGLVRLVVKKTVNGLLAQPTDALCGGAIGLAIGLAIVGLWAYSGFHLEYSNFATRAAAFLP